MSTPRQSLLRRIIKKSKLSQTKFADDFGVSRATISRMLNSTKWTAFQNALFDRVIGYERIMNNHKVNQDRLDKVRVKQFMERSFNRFFAVCLFSAICMILLSLLLSLK